jgi:D-glycero-D-manno-heptose 1,7-bisphosphate phosphatase
MVRAVFLDRDGVINRKAPEGRYITRWREVEFLPGVAEAVKRIHEAGFEVIVVSNQRAVAKGLISKTELEFLHLRMWQELFCEEKGFDAVYYCPHDSHPPCGCRKPQPGMLLTAAQNRGIDLAPSWMVGDSESDVLAGRNAGCRTIRIGAPEIRGSTAADELAESLAQAANIILASEPLTASRAFQRIFERLTRFNFQLDIPKLNNRNPSRSMKGVKR